MIYVLNLRHSQAFTLSPRRPGGEGGVRGANPRVHGAAHLAAPPTSPSRLAGPSLSPLKGGEGFRRGLRGARAWWSAER
jgi:hypothetical protein